MSRPAPRRHRAARLLALASGPSPTAERTVDVRPKPELFSSLLLTQRGRGVRYSHVYFSRFYEPGAQLAFAQPTTPSKPVRPHERSCPRSACLVIIPAWLVRNIADASTAQDRSGGHHPERTALPRSSRWSHSRDLRAALSVSRVVMSRDSRAGHRDTRAGHVLEICNQACVSQTSRACPVTHRHSSRGRGSMCDASASVESPAVGHAQPGLTASRPHGPSSGGGSTAGPGCRRHLRSPGAGLCSYFANQPQAEAPTWTTSNFF